MEFNHTQLKTSDSFNALFDRNSPSAKKVKHELLFCIIDAITSFGDVYMIYGGFVDWIRRPKPKFRNIETDDIDLYVIDEERGWELMSEILGYLTSLFSDVGIIYRQSYDGFKILVGSLLLVDITLVGKLAKDKQELCKWNGDVIYCQSENGIMCEKIAFLHSIDRNENMIKHCNNGLFITKAMTGINQYNFVKYETADVEYSINNLIVLYRECNFEADKFLEYIKHKCDIDTLVVTNKRQRLRTYPYNYALINIGMGALITYMKIFEFSGMSQDMTDAVEGLLKVSGKTVKGDWYLLLVHKEPNIPSHKPDLFDKIGHSNMTKSSTNIFNTVYDVDGATSNYAKIVVSDLNSIRVIEEEGKIIPSILFMYEMIYAISQQEGYEYYECFLPLVSWLIDEVRYSDLVSEDIVMCK